MKHTSALIIAFLLIVGTSVNAQKMDAKSKELLDRLTEVNGGYQTLLDAKDVYFKYSSEGNGKKEKNSIEKHIFSGEHSLSEYKGAYKKEEGIIKKALVNGEGMLSVNGKVFTDRKSKNAATFNSRITFYWFAMSYKLFDPSTIFSYLGKEILKGVELDKVKMVFDNSKTEKKANDEYLLYFNPETHLLDAFVFSKTGGDVIKEPKSRVFVTYESIEGVFVPVKRDTYKLDENKQWCKKAKFIISDVKFNNGYKPEDFMLK
ncbi:hypothetical protein Q4Q39_02110 [Flavivirga amylovorans]|uniref:Outer membrane lipoprotein-sorting protein n=1 Tax=Flavivirga amylovorans TaxID=870486 RepID=A0ABT8WWX0_9FLAO|nr:DUF6503 family protein [Flavivirga amylovorans]MDO5986186.1 hypothetical protein [Flavivirga amylovorans]